MRTFSSSCHYICLLAVLVLNLLSGSGARYVGRDLSSQEDLLRRQSLHQILQERSELKHEILRRALSKRAARGGAVRSPQIARKPVPSSPGRSSSPRRDSASKQSSDFFSSLPRSKAFDHPQRPSENHPAPDVARTPNHPSHDQGPAPGASSQRHGPAPGSSSNDHHQVPDARPAPEVHQQQPAGQNQEQSQAKPRTRFYPKPDLNKPLPLTPTYENVVDKKNAFQRAKAWMTDRKGYAIWKDGQDKVEEAHNLQLKNTGNQRLINAYHKDQYGGMEETLKIENEINDNRAKHRTDRWFPVDKTLQMVNAVTSKKPLPLGRRDVHLDDEDEFAFLDTRSNDYEDIYDELFL